MTPVAANLFTDLFARIGHFYHHINILRLVDHWMRGGTGYVVLFALLMSCGLGMPLPEDVPLLIAGYFVAGGQMHLALAAICAWCGIIGGDCLLYAIGRKYGMKITEVPVIGHHVSRARIEKAHDLFQKYGVWVVAVGRLFAGIRGAMVVTAGAIRFTFWHFLIADGLAAVVSGGLFMALGYIGQHRFGSLEHIRDRIESSQRLVLAALILTITAIVLWKWFKKKREHARKMAEMREKL